MSRPRTIISVGGGPAGLYYAILAKKADPSRRVVVHERNGPGDTFGFGVVFSDATMTNLAAADAESHAEITNSFSHWDDIEVHWKGAVVRSTGHGFAGLGRRRLLTILEQRALALGVELIHGTEITDVPALAASVDLLLGADGLTSSVRTAFASHFGPEIDHRPNRFVWLGTTFPFGAFTFYFRENEHGLFRVHAYRYEAAASTFIVECTDHTWRAAGLDATSEIETIAYLERLFAPELAGHRLTANRSIWRSFPTVKNARWHHDNVVLVGDAAHTAHFSIGSGTKLALEDAIALHEAIEHADDVAPALAAYESARRPGVDSTQRAAQVSLEWFEETERYRDTAPIEFAFNLLTRSLRVTHANLARRDPAFVALVNSAFAIRAAEHARIPSVVPAPPPMFTPLRLGGLLLENRVVVSPMCMYSADEGTVDDFHLVHLGSRAMGGAGLVMTEMTDIAADARITPGCAGLYTDEHVVAWRRVADFVHRHTRAKLGVQLGHAGRKGATRLMWAGIDEPLAEGAWPLVAPSAIPYRIDGQVPREMTRADMAAVRDDFVRATYRAADVGFDLLELHAAHGYLLATFISPLTNRRTDEYGGALANRMRFPLEVLGAVRAAWPADRPIAVRISACDWAPGGLGGDESVEVARLLARAGCDVIDVSSGQTVAGGKTRYGRLYQTPFSDRIRREAGVPTMTVGAVSTWDDVNSILAAGRADLVVLARAHLYDPYFTRHAAAEQGQVLDWPMQYPLAGYAPHGGVR